MMDVSPYLQAIQKVAGQTAGEKYETLNRIARKLAADCKDSSDSIPVNPSEELAEHLIPLVQLEIARISKKPKGIIDALKSEDETVFVRALKALKVKWLFGSFPNYTKAHYFRDHIFPYISLNHRKRLIKVLAARLLTYPEICEEFYLTLKEIHGVEAQPFFKGCTESFIGNTMLNSPVKLDVNELKYLFTVYPDVVIKYLKLCVSDNHPYSRNTYPSLKTYKNFLPTILKKNSKNFVELIKTSGFLDIKLSRRATNIFLRNHLNALIERPELFMPMLKFEKLAKLSRPDFQQIFKSVLPKNVKDFDFQKVYDYLKNIPENERMSYMLSSFHEVYKINLLDYTEKITPEFLRALQRPESIKQARKKLEFDRNWYADDHYGLEKSWICYLPIEESIPAIKGQISKSTLVYERVGLIMQLIYSCKVNNDEHALLEVLKYILHKHKHEQGFILLNFVERLVIDFKPQYLSGEHWDVLNELIDYCYERKKQNNYDKYFQCLVIFALHFDLMNNRCISKKVDIITEGNIEGNASNWNIIQETPEYERICIEKFMDSIPRIFPTIHENYAWTWLEVMLSFVEAIYDFNKRHLSLGIWMQKYPLFSDAMRKLVTDKFQNEEDITRIKKLRLLLKINEPEVYDLWIDEQDKNPMAEVFQALVMLKRNPQRIIDKWEIYYERCKSIIYSRVARRFINAIRWYQDLPMKFIAKSLDNIDSNEDDPDSLAVLGTLIEGPAFEQFMATFISKLSVNININIEQDQTSLMEVKAASLKIVNPPVSVYFILQFCGEDYIDVLEKHLVHCGRRIAGDKLFSFCQQLMNRQVSLKILGIKLFREIATIQQLRSTLINLWRTERHKSVRLVIVEMLLTAFRANPCAETWDLVNECVDGLTIDDNDILKSLKKLFSIKNMYWIPNEYVADYIRKLLTILKKVGDTENSFGCTGVWFHTRRILENLSSNVAVLFPEEFHEEIIRTYLADLSAPKEVFCAAQMYLLNCYILPAGGKLDVRLKIFSDIFIEILSNNWNAPNLGVLTCYPVHDFLQGFVKHVVLDTEYSSEKSKLINTALDVFGFVLNPREAPEFYCKLKFATLRDDKTTPMEFAEKIGEIIPSLVDIFCIEFISSIAQFLHSLINYFWDFKIEPHLDVIESLIRLNDDHVTYLAASLLLCESDRLWNTRYWKIIKNLQQHKHPWVICSANLAMNYIKY